MRSQDIRETFLRFFEDRGHVRMPSASLIPHDDPSILFTVAGMVPLKSYFLGERTPPGPRATTCQKCFRTNDIEEVGYTPRHDTFFEMLGNFSFGDYFKPEAVDYAWELLTQEFALPVPRLWVSIHPGDEVAHVLWTKRIGLAEERLVRLEDNFWEAGRGLPGPCGYDSEVYWDRQVACSCGRPDCLPGCEGDRWVEVWNLVFMEFDRDQAGAMKPLPKPSIDTGMGIERIAAVLQDKASIFDSDLFVPIVAGFERRATAAQDPQERLASLRVCADHVRAAAFLIADGVFPANEGRGYVLRRLIRRAALHARRLGLEDGLNQGVGDVIEVMGGHYGELREHRALIERTLRTEEQGFSRTLEAGAERLDNLLESSGTISGGDAFRLYDTYGLPVELTVELAGQRGVHVDREGFQAAMDEQRSRSKAASQPVRLESVAGLPATTFVGYDSYVADATVLQIGMEALPELPVGEEAAVFFDLSPFYAEAGGQTGDTGMLSWPGGRGAVLDTVPLAGGARAHRVRVEAGRLATGQLVHATVDAARGAQVARHHSATHLLHKALREVLGETVLQRGSSVGAERATFDFSFERALRAEEIAEVEHLLNDHIRNNHPRTVQLLSVEEARASGAVALFGEKYGEVVRVVDFGGWARELCGGTHVDRSGDVGAAIIVADSSIGQGIRRIELVAGSAAEAQWRDSGRALREAARSLRVRPPEVPERVVALQAQVRLLQRQLDESRRSGATAAGPLDPQLEVVSGISVGHLVLGGGSDGRQVVEVTDRIFAERLGAEGVAIGFGEDTVAVKVGPAAQAAGVNAGALARAAAEATGGRGGGRPDFARGGIKDPSRREAALAAIRAALNASETP